MKFLGLWQAAVTFLSIGLVPLNWRGRLWVTGDCFSGRASWGGREVWHLTPAIANQKANACIWVCTSSRKQMSLRSSVQWCSELVTNLMSKSKPLCLRGWLLGFGSPSLSMGLGRSTSESSFTQGKFSKVTCLLGMSGHLHFSEL